MKPRDRPRIITPPANSAIASWYPGANLLDAQAVSLPADAPDDAQALAHLLLDQPPRIVRWLLAARDAIMATVGVKSSSSIRSAQDGRTRIDFFPVLSSTATEIILGEDDRHLDFRTSIMIMPDNGGRLVVSTTAVRCHNRLGRLYLWIITPFHLAIVRSSLSRLHARIDSAGASRPHTP